MQAMSLSRYMDHNATTPVDPAVTEAMIPYLRDLVANPSSPYSAARRAARAIEDARVCVAKLVGAPASRVVFTGGGTESANAAIRGLLAAVGEGASLAVSSVEHACVREVADRIHAGGGRVIRIGVDDAGALRQDELDRALAQRPSVLSVMAANNETGVVYDLRMIGAQARNHGTIVHTDAVQAAGKIPVDMEGWGVDAMSICAHKINGPKGVGALLLREGVGFESMLVGGDQEDGRRAGTENVAGIVGFGVAADLARQRLGEESARLRVLRDVVEAQVVSAISGVRVVGQGQPRLPNTSLLLMEGVDAEALIARLDMEGFCVSSGSACASGASEPSHVLRAMGVPKGLERSAIRISLGAGNDREGAELLVRALQNGVHALRGHRA